MFNPVANRPTRRAILGGITASLIAPLTGIPAHSASAAHPSTPSPMERREKPAPSLELLTDILQVLPGTLAEMEDSGTLFVFVDLDAQRKALDLPAFDPATGEPSVDQWNALSMLPLWMSPFLYSRDEEFIQLIGFHPLAAKQAMEISSGAQRVTLIRGGFDPAAIHGAWEAAGYARMETGIGEPAWSSGPDGAFSPDDPLQRRSTGSLNNVMVLNDEWLIFTRFFDHLDAIASFAAATTADSLFASTGVSETIAMLDDETVAAVAVPGDLLTPEATIRDGSTATEALAASDEETGALPAASILMTAVTGGLTPIVGEENTDALKHVVLQARAAFSSQIDATVAAKTIAHRWESLVSQTTGTPYTDYLIVTETDAVNSVAALDFAVSGAPAFWQRMIRERDWLPFVTTAG